MQVTVRLHAELEEHITVRVIQRWPNMTSDHLRRRGRDPRTTRRCNITSRKATPAGFSPYASRGHRDGRYALLFRELSARASLRRRGLRPGAQGRAGAGAEPAIGKLLRRPRPVFDVVVGRGGELSSGNRPPQRHPSFEKLREHTT